MNGRGPMNVPMSVTDARPMRRDAVRNQRLVLDAAAAVLSEYGTDATMELIASRAGVGVGTIYRNYPNKDALTDALVQSIFDELLTAGRAALELPAGTGLEQLLRALGESMSQHRGYARMLVGHIRAASGSEQLREQLARLVEQARTAGELGSWVTLGDVMSLVWALRGVVETTGAVAPTAWERLLEVHLRALREPDPASRRAGVSARQLERIASEPG
jgi:AcrR family transcriptional regulator